MHTKPNVWDTAALKAHRQAEIGKAEHAQSQEDWHRATIYIERALSDKRGISEFCTLPGCRRARRCLGNPTVCLAPDASRSAQAQAAIGDIYVKIQEQRRAATVDGRKLDLLDPVTLRLPRRRQKGLAR
jgi:hypothetical protein